MTEPEKKNLRTLVGRVISNKMRKSAVVAVERRVIHPIIGKHVLRSTNLTIDDPGNACQDGDVVKIRERRPLSKNKNWELVEVLEKNQ